MENSVPQPLKPEAGLFLRIWRMIWIRSFFIFCLGFLAGYGILIALHSSGKSPETGIPVKQAQAAGTPAAEVMQDANALHFDSPLAKGACKVRYSAKTVEISVELTSLYPVKSVIEFDVNNFIVLEVRNVNVNDQSTTLTASNLVQFNSVGDNKYLVVLSNENALPNKIDFTLTQNEVTIYQNSVEVNND